MMNKRELKKVQDSLKRKGLIDEETFLNIDNEIQHFLEKELEKNTDTIKKLLKEKKSFDNIYLIFSSD